MNLMSVHLVKHPGAPVLLSGDLNTNHQALAPWMRTWGWISPPHDLAPPEGVNTYWKYALPPGEVDYSGTSWIDHTLLHGSSQVQAVEIGLCTGTFWNTVSEHRPLDLTLTSPWYDIGVTPQAPSLLTPSIARIDLVSTTEPKYLWQTSLVCRLMTTSSRATL